jgi:hypothetical protein
MGNRKEPQAKLKVMTYRPFPKGFPPEGANLAVEAGATLSFD